MTATEMVALRVTPRAKNDEIVGWREDTLLVRVKAPPTEGKANEAVRRLLARAAGTRINEIEVVAGATSRDKRIRLPADAVAQLRRVGEARLH